LFLHKINETLLKGRERERETERERGGGGGNKYRWQGKRWSP
jgi:hypothetical protein